MNHYLEKIARTEEEQKNRKMSLGQIGLAGVGGSLAGSALSTPLALLGQGPVKKELDATTPEIKKEHLRKMLRNNPQANVTFNLGRTSNKRPDGRTSRAGSFMQNQSVNGMPHYNPVGKVSGTGKNYISGRGTPNTGIIAHEIGHAVDYGNSSRRRTLARMGVRIGAPVAAAGAGLEMIRRDDDSTKYAPLATLAGSAPVLVDEAKANYHGYKELKRAGGKVPANKFLTRIASKNMLGYGSAAAAGALSTGVLTGIVQKTRQKNQESAKRKSKRSAK